MHGSRFGYALANGTVGVYDRTARYWRIKVHVIFEKRKAGYLYEANDVYNLSLSLFIVKKSCNEHPCF